MKYNSVFVFLCLLLHRTCCSHSVSPKNTAGDHTRAGTTAPQKLGTSGPSRLMSSENAPQPTSSSSNISLARGLLPTSNVEATTLDAVTSSSGNANSSNTVPRQDPFVSMLVNMFLSAANTTPSTNTTSPTFSLPLSLLAMQNKLPGGMGNSLLPLLMGGGDVNLESIAGLFESLGPQLPSILKGLIQSNTSGLGADERTCSEDVDTFLVDLLQGKPWALSMLDASGKPGTSIMEGATTFFGNFDECLDGPSQADPTSGREVKGDTCVVYISPPPQLIGMVAGTVGNVFSAMANTIMINWHLCVPDTCGSNSVKSGIQRWLSQVNMTVKGVVCHAEIKSGPVGDDSAAVGAIVLTAILGCLVLVGTALDMNIRATKGRRDQVPVSPRLDAVQLSKISTQLQSHDVGVPQTSKGNGAVDGRKLMDESRPDVETVGIDNPAGPKVQETNDGHFVYPNGGHQLRSEDKEHDNKYKPKLWQRVLLCFSAVSNGEKILSVKRSPGSLTCLNGIRVLSMGWVILGHTFLTLMPNAENPKIFGRLTQSFSFQIITNATLSVDSFFLLSGLLVTYLFLKETEKAGGLKVKHMILYYVHRYLRLTPIYAYVIFINTFLVVYLTDGPTWMGSADSQFCVDNWWTNLLYINNVYREKTKCLGWGWYLAGDMQFYVVAPLALIPLALSFSMKNRTARKILKVDGLGVILGFLLTSIVSTAYITHSIDGDLFHNGTEFSMRVYVKPWCRIGPFAIGMALGYILQRKKSELKMSQFLQVVGWLLALVAAGACTLDTYDNYGEGRPGWGNDARTAHETLCRPVWGLVLAWVIFMCCKGKAGIVDWMLSWAWWQPLSRLTYGVYLIHLILIRTDSATMRSLFFYSSGYIVYRFFGYVCMSFIFSFLLAILVEAPMLQLEKLVLS
ncbi:O-acyltransferase like protein-like [Haliotis cracherodii]|uniref:O-acyltransferase like protein-like n=1 Tax=Haliotis cracherodii TaxID=6455 RepID=UPI0039EBE2CA